MLSINPFLIYGGEIYSCFSYVCSFSPEGWKWQNVARSQHLSLEGFSADIYMLPANRKASMPRPCNLWPYYYTTDRRVSFFISCCHHVCHQHVPVNIPPTSSCELWETFAAKAASHVNPVHLLDLTTFYHLRPRLQLCHNNQLQRALWSRLPAFLPLSELPSAENDYCVLKMSIRYQR